jgi:polysaccharide export outer membrane protein
MIDHVMTSGRLRRGSLGMLCLMLTLVAACSGSEIPPAPSVVAQGDTAYYLIGPGDTLEIFVWENETLTQTVPVRPDGRLSVPLINDIEAVGRTPSALADEIEAKMAEFIIEPNVTVMVTEFSGIFDQQIRVIGEAQKPQAIPYRDGMTVLDVLIEVGGLTEFASGNRAVIARKEGDLQKQYRVRLDDLIRDGEVSANVDMRPGDILIIPQRFL